MPSSPRSAAGDAGQATVELVALIPVLVVVGLALHQALLVGQALWLTGSAARAAARAHAVGTDAERAARRVLPDHLEHALRVRDGGDGEVRVTVRLPAIGGTDLGTVTRVARMEPQR